MTLEVVERDAQSAHALSRVGACGATGKAIERGHTNWVAVDVIDAKPGVWTALVTGPRAEPAAVEVGGANSAFAATFSGAGGSIKNYGNTGIGAHVEVNTHRRGRAAAVTPHDTLRLKERIVDNTLARKAFTSAFACRSSRTTVQWRHADFSSAIDETTFAAFAVRVLDTLRDAGGIASIVKTRPTEAAFISATRGA